MKDEGLTNIYTFHRMSIIVVDTIFLYCIPMYTGIFWTKTYLYSENNNNICVVHDLLKKRIGRFL